MYIDDFLSLNTQYFLVILKLGIQPEVEGRLHILIPPSMMLAQMNDLKREYIENGMNSTSHISAVNSYQRYQDYN